MPDMATVTFPSFVEYFFKESIPSQLHSLVFKKFSPPIIFKFGVFDRNFTDITEVEPKVPM